MKNPKQLKRVESPKTKMRDIVSASFSTAFNVLLQGNHPIKTAYAILNINNKIQDFKTDYEKLRLVLLEKYGKKGVDGKLELNADKTQYILSDGAKFQKEHNELLDLEVEVPRISLTSLENVNMSPLALAPLMGVVLDP